MDREKVEAGLKWEEPKTIKVLRGFLGLTGYYRRFVKDYGKVVRPLINLLKKGSFVWTELARKAMDRLKEAVTTAPVLSMPDFTQSFHVEYDALGVRVGEVLTFFSKALCEGSLGKYMYEKELMAL